MDQRIELNDIIGMVVDEPAGHTSVMYVDRNKKVTYTCSHCDDPAGHDRRQSPEEA